jgi:hypothetical protein
VLGEGGMGIVLRGYDEQLDRDVALKVIRPILAEKPELRERFLREARLLAQVQHPHVVPIYHVGDEAGLPFIAMPLLQGETLQVYIERTKHIPLNNLRRIARELAEGLQAVHERGLIHRDIKPSNVWMEGEEPRALLLDFGVAREENAPWSGVIVGTPSYMAPEQARGEQVDARADLYALGRLIRDMAGGRRLPPELDRLVSRLLSDSPEDRPGSAREVADALREARPVPWILLGAGVLSLVLLVVALLRLMGPQPPPPGPRPPLPRVPLPEWVLGTPAEGVLEVLAGEEPPEPEAGLERPALSLDVWGRRLGESGYRALIDGDPLASQDDRYFIVARPRPTGHLYLFQIDPTGAVAWLFPKNPGCAISYGANPVAAGSGVQFPPRETGSALNLDDHVGPEQVFAVLSATRWPLLEEALARSSKARGKAGAVREAFPLHRGVSERGPASLVPRDDAPVVDGKRVEAQPVSDLLRASGTWLVGSRWFRHVKQGN